MDRFLAAVQGFVRWNWTARWTWHLPRCRAAARFLWLGAVGGLRTDRSFVGLLRLAQATTDFSMHEPKPDALCSIGHGNPFVEVSI